MILELLRSYSKGKVMVIGDLMLDRYLFGEINRKSAEAPIDIVDVNTKLEQVGGAANVALSLKNIKTNVFLFGLIGNDYEGNKILSILKKNKIKTSGIFKNKQTTIKTRVITSKSKHHSRFDIEKINYNHTIEKKTLLKKIKLHIPEVDFIIIQDYNKGLLDKTMIKSILSTAKKHNKEVMVDPKEKNFIEYKKVKLIKPNLKEAELFLNQKIKLNNKSLKKACEEIRIKTKSDWIILTLGKKGLCILNDGNFYKQNGQKKINPDVTGAGDNVICISSLLVHLKLPINKIAEISNECGALSCDKIGTNPINLNELLTKLEINN